MTICDVCCEPLTVHDSGDSCARCDLLRVLGKAIGDQAGLGVHQAVPAAAAALKVFEDDEFYEPVVAYLNGRWR